MTQRAEMHPVMPQDLFEVFLSVLELNRLPLIEGADRIVPMNVARELSSGDSAGLPSGFETRVKEVIEVVRPLLPAAAEARKRPVAPLNSAAPSGP